MRPTTPTLQSVHTLPIHYSIWCLLTQPACVFYRYKLKQPAPSYAGIFSDVQARFDLCVRAAALLESRPSLPLHLALPMLLQPSPAVPLGSNTVYSHDDLRKNAAFMFGQLLALSKVSRGNIPLTFRILAPFYGGPAWVHITLCSWAARPAPV